MREKESLVENIDSGYMILHEISALSVVKGSSEKSWSCISDHPQRCLNYSRFSFLSNNICPKKLLYDIFTGKLTRKNCLLKSYFSQEFNYCCLKYLILLNVKGKPPPP